MFWICADDAHHALAVDYLALIANLSDGCTYLHKALLVSISYAPAIQIVWRQFDQNSISRKNSDEVLTHFAGNMGQHLVLAFFQFDPKHCIRQRLENFGHHFYRFFLRHTLRQTQISLCWQTSNTNMRIRQFQARRPPAPRHRVRVTPRSQFVRARRQTAQTSALPGLRR